jgi:hypothetical protein
MFAHPSVRHALVCQRREHLLARGRGSSPSRRLPRPRRAAKGERHDSAPHSSPHRNRCSRSSGRAGNLGAHQARRHRPDRFHGRRIGWPGRRRRGRPDRRPRWVARRSIPRAPEQASTPLVVVHRFYGILRLDYRALVARRGCKQRRTDRASFRRRRGRHRWVRQHAAGLQTARRRSRDAVTAWRTLMECGNVPPSWHDWLAGLILRRVPGVGVCGKHGVGEALPQEPTRPHLIRYRLACFQARPAAMRSGAVG